MLIKLTAGTAFNRAFCNLFDMRGMLWKSGGAIVELQDLRCNGEIGGLEMEYHRERKRRTMKETRTWLAKAKKVTASEYKNRKPVEISEYFSKRAVDQVGIAFAYSAMKGTKGAKVIVA